MSTLQVVVARQYLGNTKDRGFIASTGLYKLTLACGHTQIRTDNNYDVKRAKCRETDCQGLEKK